MIGVWPYPRHTEGSAHVPSNPFGGVPKAESVVPGVSYAGAARREGWTSAF